MGTTARLSRPNDTGSGVDALGDLARRHPGLVVFARAGWLAKGIVYALVGFLAFRIAFPSDDAAGGTAPGSGEEASQTGAIAEIAETSWGTTALWVVAIGLLLYVVWRIVSILLPAEDSAKAWATRAGYAVSAVVYAVLAWSAISIARHGGSSQSENSRVEQFTVDLMERTGGRWLVGLLGVALVAIGGYFAHKGLTESFRDDLEPGGVGPVRGEWIVGLGKVGWCGRAAMMALIGFFLVRAAVQFDPAEAEGLDGALRRLVDESWGPFLVAAVGVGLVLYGAFCVISAPRQRLRGAG